MNNNKVLITIVIRIFLKNVLLVLMTPLLIAVAILWGIREGLMISMGLGVDAGLAIISDLLNLSKKIGGE